MLPEIQHKRKKEEEKSFAKENKIDKWFSSQP